MVDASDETKKTPEAETDDKQQVETPAARPGRTMDHMLSLKELAKMEPTRTGVREGGRHG